MEGGDAGVDFRGRKLVRTKEEAIEHFRYKSPCDVTAEKHQKVTEAFIGVIESLWDAVPDGPGKTYALRKLADARMSFNSAIANNGQ